MHVRFRSIEEVPIDQLEIGNSQARRRAVEEGLDELVDSIRVNNQLEPIVVAPISNRPDRYEIIIGQRRYLAHQRLGRQKILAAILDRPMDEATAKSLSLSENLIRRDMNEKDLIDVCTEFYQKYGSVKAASEELGLPYHRVRSYVKFDRLRPELKQLVSDGRVDVQTALRVEDAFKDRATQREGDLADLATNLAAMTRAQQQHVLKEARRAGSNGRKVAEPVALNGGGVRQVVVTLSHSDHRNLQAWARKEGMTQDQAAGAIISSFLARHKIR